MANTFPTCAQRSSLNLNPINYGLHTGKGFILIRIVSTILRLCFEALQIYKMFLKIKCNTLKT